MKNIALLGSTGSIGRNVLEVVRQFPGRFRVLGLAAGNNIRLLREQIEAFDPELVSVGEAKLAGDLAQSLPQGWTEKIVSGTQGNIAVATMPGADTVVSAIVGAAGLTPTMAGIEAGKNVALANKETLVMAGAIVMAAAKRHKVSLLPIDSEHSAIAQALEAGKKPEVHKLILTASGGPFRDVAQRDLWGVTPDQALAHPNWDMGRKISIDSATLMNKGLEVIEARWLFDMDVENIEVLIHPQSIVHSMVEYVDGSVVAQLGVPDMRIPIAYALSYPERLRMNLPRLNLATAPDLSFYRPDFEKFPALKLAYQAGKKGGTLPAILNAANEVAVDAFLAGNIRFPEIVMTVAETMARMPEPEEEAAGLAAVLDADLAARVQAASIIEAITLQTTQRLGREAHIPELPPGQKTLTIQRP